MVLNHYRLLALGDNCLVELLVMMDFWYDYEGTLQRRGWQARICRHCSWASLGGRLHSLIRGLSQSTMMMIYIHTDFLDCLIGFGCSYVEIEYIGIHNFF